MARRGSAALAATLTLACSSAVERVAITLPIDTPAVLAVQREGRVSAWVLDGPTPLATLEPIADWDGSAIELALVEADLAALDLRPGPLAAPSPEAPSRTLESALGAGARAFSRRLVDADDSGWAQPDRLPTFIAALPVPDISPCTRIRGHSTGAAGALDSITSLAQIPAHEGVARALVGVERIAGAGGWGVATATDAATRVRDLTWPDLAMRSLTWDGRETVWAVVVGAFVSEQRIVAMDLIGHERRSTVIARADNEALAFVRTWDGRMLAYSSARVLELSDTSTQTRDRTREYPADLIALLEVAPEQRFALTAGGSIVHFDGGAWVVEARMLPEVERLYAAGGSLIALSEARLFVRNDAGEWPALADPFPTINKLDVADLGGGRMLVGGGAGLLAVYSAARGWCTATTGHTRYHHGLQALDGQAVAFEYLAKDGAPTTLYWFTL